MAAERRHKDQLLGILIAIVAFLTYANTIVNGFVWDDKLVIKNKEALRGDLVTLYTIPDKILDTDASVYYRPLTYTTFLLEERLHGLNPSFMHLVNALLHAVNAYLVFLVARTLFSTAYAACVAELLFAVHPINSETVNFLSGGRNTLLACLFVLIAYLLHERSARRNGLYGAVAGGSALLAGLLSKEIALAVLPFICATEYRALTKGSSEGRRKALLRLLPYFAGMSVYLILRAAAVPHMGISFEITGLVSRLLNNIYIIPRYLLVILWPASLSIKYDLPDDFHVYALPIVAGWGCIVGLLGWALSKKDRRGTIFGIAWAAAFLLPTSGIVPFPSAPMAERYLYVPAIGLWMIIAERTAWVFTSSLANIRRFVAAATILALGTLHLGRKDESCAGFGIEFGPDDSKRVEQGLFAQAIEVFRQHLGGVDGVLIVGQRVAIQVGHQHGCGADDLQ